MMLAVSNGFLSVLKMMSLYPTEWLNLAYFSFFLILSRMISLNSVKRRRVLWIGTSAIFLLIVTVMLDEVFHSSETSVFRNFLPAVLMVFAYWQSGQFYLRPNLRLQQSLHNLDREIARFLDRFRFNIRFKMWIDTYLEIAYLFCYPMVPLGVAVFYLMKLDPRAQEFWTIVLPPSYICYALVAFAQTHPPRVLEGTGIGDQKPGPIRKFNMGIIQHTSIQINTFPSAHAASSMAVALALIQFVPVAGWIFLWVAMSIAIAAVVGRYHFVADVVLGAAIALIWFAIWSAGSGL